MKTVLGGAFFVGISFLFICSFPMMPYGASHNNPEQLQSSKPPSLQAPRGLGGSREGLTITVAQDTGVDCNGMQLVYT